MPEVWRSKGFLRGLAGGRRPGHSDLTKICRKQPVRAATVGVGAVGPMADRQSLRGRNGWLRVFGADRGFDTPETVGDGVGALWNCLAFGLRGVFVFGGKFVLGRLEGKSLTSGPCGGVFVCNRPVALRPSRLTGHFRSTAGWRPDPRRPQAFWLILRRQGPDIVETPSFQSLRTT